MKEQVTQYIADNVLHSKLFDVATESQKTKAINQASITLLRYLPDVYKDEESLPVEDVAEQVLWLLKLDDSIQRAELGATGVSVDGISVQYREMDRTIAPNILNLYGIKDTRRKRIGSYTDAQAYRTGIGRY